MLNGVKHPHNDVMLNEVKHLLPAAEILRLRLRMTLPIVMLNASMSC
jgi:hypothetical protein